MRTYKRVFKTTEERDRWWQAELDRAKALGTRIKAVANVPGVYRLEGTRGARIFCETVWLNLTNTDTPPAGFVEELEAGRGYTS